MCNIFPEQLLPNFVLFYWHVYKCGPDRKSRKNISNILSCTKWFMYTMKLHQAPVSVAAGFRLQNKFGKDQINSTAARTWIEKKGDYIKFGMVHSSFLLFAAHSQPKNLIHFFGFVSAHSHFLFCTNRHKHSLRVNENTLDLCVCGRHWGPVWAQIFILKEAGIGELLKSSLPL